LFNVYGDAIQLWGIRNLTDFLRHAQNCSFPPVNPANSATLHTGYLPLPCMQGETGYLDCRVK